MSMSDDSEDSPPPSLGEALRLSEDTAMQLLHPTLPAEKDARSGVGNKDNITAGRVSLGMAPAGQRGKNWSEGDSLLLLKAYGWIEENKQSWESKTFQETRMYQYWQTLGPEEMRNQKSVIARWNQMLSMFRFVVNFNNHRIAGSTGQPNWFLLTPEKWNEHLQVKAQKEKNFKKKITLTQQVFDEMYKIMGNRANVKPPYTFKHTTPVQFRGSVDDDATDSTDVNTTDLEGSQRGKKKRRMSMRPDSQEIVTAMLELFQNKWDDDRKTAASIRADEKEERQRILAVMQSSQQSFSALIDVLRVISEKM